MHEKFKPSRNQNFHQIFKIFVWPSKFFNFSSWPFRFSILIFRQAKRRRLTLDSLNSSNAEIETALKNHKKEEIVLNINTTPTEEENKLITQLKGKFKVISWSTWVIWGHLRLFNPYWQISGAWARPISGKLILSAIL